MPAKSDIFPFVTDARARR